AARDRRSRGIVRAPLPHDRARVGRRGRRAGRRGGVARGRARDARRACARLALADARAALVGSARADPALGAHRDARGAGRVGPRAARPHQDGTGVAGSVGTGVGYAVAIWWPNAPYEYALAMM